MPLKVAIVSGHSEAKQGAVSVTGAQEWAWNNVLADQLTDELRAVGVEVVRLVRPNDSYTSAMITLTRELNKAKPTCAIELHFDGGDPAWHGACCLYWPGSVAGEALAERLATAAARAAGVRNRGPRPQTHSSQGLPLYFLRSVKCPSVILESHFGSNAEDHWLATKARDDGELARELAAAVVQWWQDWQEVQA